MWNCVVCSSKNEASRVRCAECGTPIKDSRLATTRVRPAAETQHAETARPRPSPPSGTTELQAAPPPASEPDAFLVSSLLEVPFPLCRSRIVHLGRAPTNTIVLPVPQVSRVHATISWNQAGFQVADRGSKNGTTVNGETVHRRPLVEGDVIGIGVVEFAFTTKLVNGASTLVNGDTIHEGLTSTSSLAGELRDVRLAEVWQMLELNQKTGRLRVRCGESSGWIYFDGGRAVHAQVGARRGEPAALELLRLNDGCFRFFPTPSIEVERTILRPSSSLLIEAARIADESGEQVA